MKIHFATWPEDNQGKSLTKAGNKNRLKSFFFLQKEKKDYLKEYVKNGQVDRRKK
jgi:autonomous glycyl radical cofactor GrcA